MYARLLPRVRTHASGSLRRQSGDDKHPGLVTDDFEGMVNLVFHQANIPRSADAACPVGDPQVHLAGKGYVVVSVRGVQPLTAAGLRAQEAQVGNHFPVITTILASTPDKDSGISR